MSTAIVEVYYILLVIFVFFYLFKRDKRNVNIRDIVYAITFITTSVGGVYCAYGYASLELCNLRINVLLCYIFFFVIITLSFIGIRKKSIYRFGRHLDFPISDKAIWYVYCFILVYTIAYFYFLKDIPLINLIRTGDVAAAVINRLEVTHDIAEYYDVPFVFRYAKFLRETPMFLLTCISFVKYQNNKKYRLMFFVILFTTLFYQTYALEKAGVIYIIIILFFSYYHIKKQASLFSMKVFIPIILICISIYAMYSFFMGQEDNIFESIVNRACIRQTGWIYFQDQILSSKFGGSLNGGGISIFLFDSLLGRSPVSLSTEVYEMVYSQYSKEGYVGTTGGMPLFYFYSNFGMIIGCIIFYFLCHVVAKVDNTLNQAEKVNQNKLVIVAVQATFLCLCIQGFMGNMSTIFMLPFFWSPQVLALLITVVSLKKLS